MRQIRKCGVETLARLALTMLLAAGSAAPALASSASKGGASIGMARIDGTAGTVESFGGKGTESATASGGGGIYYVTFDGRYPSTITPNDVILQATCNSGAYGVSNAYVSSATPTQITVRVYCWTSSTLTYVTNDVFVNVFAGAAP